MTNFKINQKVVYITGVHHPKGSIHIIMGIKTLLCGCVKLNIGEPDDDPDRILFHCKKHPHIIDNKDGYNWYQSESFRPLEYNSATSEILEKFPLTEEKADVKIREHEEQLINQ